MHASSATSLVTRTVTGWFSVARCRDAPSTTDPPRTVTASTVPAVVDVVDALAAVVGGDWPATVGESSPAPQAAGP